jgi:hypothetical protein
VAGKFFPTLKARQRVYRKRHPLRRSALLLGGVALVYGIASAVLAVTGAVPLAPVVAGMDVDNYYTWQIVFILPLVFAVWILTSGVLLALGTKGCHRSDVLVGASRGLGVSLLLASVPSVVEAGFAVLGMGQTEWVGILSEPGIWQTLYLAVYAGAAGWAVYGLIRAARTIHKKSWPAAVATGLAASAVAAGAFVLFVR